MQQTELAALIIVAALIVMDYMAGLAKAFHAHDVSSVKMREGLWHKGSYIGVMALAELIEHAQPYLDLGFTVPLVIPAAAYISITEITSIIENLGELNPELKNSPLIDLFRTNEKQKGE